MLIALLIYYFVMLGILIYASYPTKLEPHRLLFKVLTSVGFIAIATYCALISGALSLYVWMIPAFAACLVGDIFMARTDNHWDDRVFTLGVVFFAIAHLAFLVAISRLFPFDARELILPIIVAVVALFIDRVPGMDVKTMKPALVPYGFLVAWLFSKTLVWVTATPATTISTMMCAGAALFFASDLILLLIYFHTRQFKPMRFVNQVTYYGGMALLACALLFA